MKTKKKPIFVSVATQKGGAGKSTFTILAASILQYKLGKNVAIIDCDSTQGSIHGLRERDLETLSNSPKIQSLLAIQQERSEKSLYPIKRVSSLEVINPDKSKSYLALDVAEELSQSQDLDYIFFDMPGSVKVSGVLKTLLMMDYIFCPFSNVTSDIESSLAFCRTLINGVIKAKVGNLKTVYGFWNQIDSRAKTSAFDKYIPVFSDLGVEMLETRIPQLVRFGKEISNNPKPTEIFKSTILAPQGSLYGSGVNDLVDEMVKAMDSETN